MLAYKIQYPNGLWYYSLDLAKRKNLILVLRKDQISWDKQSVEWVEVTTALRVKMFFSNYQLVVPTIRPILSLSSRNMTIVHDEWPLIQPQVIKRMVMKVVLLYCRLTSTIVTISNYGAHLFRSTEVWLNEEVELPYKNPLIHVDYLIIGLETGRKKLEIILNYLENYAESSSVVAFVGTLTDKECEKNILDKGYMILPSYDLPRVVPNSDMASYISASICEGFNRGASFAKGRKFKLILSDIPVHREFFPEANWLENYL